MSNKEGAIMPFNHYELATPILKTLESVGYEHPTKIQHLVIPHALKKNDIIGTAQTGTGKTAAFALPIIHHLLNQHQLSKKTPPRALILTPTRELALQVKESFDDYSRRTQVKTLAVYGGMPKRNQIIKLKRGVNVLVATPGRLLDLMSMNIIDLSSIEHLVLDEFDQMLDMGFIDDVSKIIDKMPKNRHTMLFSATLPKPILKLAQPFLNNAVRLETAPQNTPLETITHKGFILHKESKPELLKETLKAHPSSSTLVFVRTKQGCNHLVHYLLKQGIYAEALHGDKPQRLRQKTLLAFKNKELKVLIATDVASRGLDIEALPLVINYDLPESPEVYLHRIGRTARAGLKGEAYSFCGLEETRQLKRIQEHIKITIPIDHHHAYNVRQQEKPFKKRSRRRKRTFKQA